MAYRNPPSRNPPMSRLESQVSVDAQPSDMSSFYSSLPPGLSQGIPFDSLSSSHDQEMQRLIDEYKDRMPSDVKICYYDVMILYAEADRDEAEKYRDHLKNDIVLEGGRRIMAVLYDDQELVSLAGGKFKSLDYGFQRCTFAFIYLTKSFCMCEWSTLSSEECLMESIYNPEKKWCVVPVYTVSRSKADFKIPMGLNSLKGVNYYNNDDFYRRGLKRLVGDKVMVRLNKNREHFRRQYQYACQLRNEDIVKRKYEEDLHRYQELKRQELERQNQEKLRMKQKTPPTEHEEGTTEAAARRKQQELLQEFQSSEKTKSSVRAKNYPVESEEMKYARSEKLHPGGNPGTKYKTKPNPVEHESMEKLQMPKKSDVNSEESPHLSGLELDCTSMNIVQKGLNNKVEVHHYHYYPDGPGQVTKNYNISNAGNVAIGENATIVSSGGTEYSEDEGEEDKEEEEIHQTHPRPRISIGKAPSMDAAPSTAAGDSPRNSEPLTGLSGPLEHSNSSENCDTGGDRSQKLSSNTKISRGISGEESESKPAVSFCPPQSKETGVVKAKPLAGVSPQQRSKPVVAMVSPMQSISKPSYDEKEETHLKHVQGDSDPETTELKQSVAPYKGSENTNTNLQKTIPKHLNEDDDPDNTVLKKVAPVSCIRPQVVNAQTQGNSEPGKGEDRGYSTGAPVSFVTKGAPASLRTKGAPISSKTKGAPAVSEKMYENDVVEDGDPSDCDSKRESDGFVEVWKEDLPPFNEPASMGTDVDSASLLTKDEKSLECVKTALAMGFPEKKIKQALVKLHAKGKVDINLLLDEMQNEISDTNSPPANANPVSQFEISPSNSTSNDTKPHGSKSKDSQSQQKSGFFQRLLNSVKK